MAGYFKPQSKRKDSKAALFLTFSFLLFIGFAGAAFFLMTNISSNGGANNTPQTVMVKEEAPQYDKVKVLAPIKEIPSGTSLSVEMFKLVELPTVALSEGTIANVEEIQGMYARTLMLADQSFTKSHIMENEPNSVIAPKIPSGFRAVTIKVNSTSGVEGWALPDSLVDVHWNTKISGEDSMVTIVENAKVLSAAGRVNKREPNEPAPSTVTLLVRSKDAQKILLAKKTGSLDLTLRGTDDTGAATNGGTISEKDLYGGDSGDKKVPENIRGTVIMGGIKYLVKANGELQQL